ncbi:hypothetical protein GCM10009858_01230 [Terrabacter carboxydivorans]|uniref:Secreted protein n=1 Tax=Terrabacter carboxydivorans TaxID=619730 RepID=A0ABN3KSZ1_9MICO
MSRTQPPLLEVGDGVGRGGCFVLLGLGFGLPLVGLGAAVEVGAGGAGGAVEAVLGEGGAAVVVGTDDVGADAGSTTAVAWGLLDAGPVAPGAVVALAEPEDDSADPHPSSVDVLAQLPPGRPGKPPEAIASSLQLSPDQ